MNLLGIDLKPLLNELTKFRESQQEIINLLKENNQLNQQILTKLGG
jgi:hypothetical protein